MTVDEYYNKLCKDVFKYVIDMRKKQPELAILELIYQYALINNLELELVGDAIYDNEEFKSMIASECKIKSRNDVVLEEW